MSIRLTMQNLRFFLSRILTAINNNNSNLNQKMVQTLKLLGRLSAIAMFITLSRNNNSNSKNSKMSNKLIKD